MSMINIKLNEDTQCIVIRNGEEETVKHPKGTCFFDVEESSTTPEWLFMDDDMIATFIPKKNGVVLS